MSQVSSKLRRGTGAYFHWCPGCEETHPLPDSWTFNGDLEKPTFSPSLKHSGHNLKGLRVCHYVLTDGILNFCSDSTHDLAGKKVAIPDLPEGLRDDG